MASTAKAYRNPDRSSSENERQFFTRAEIENFFDTCPQELLSRRFHHFLRGAWIAAGRPFGGEILFFKATEDYQKACRYRSARTVRYNLRAAEDLGLLEIAHRDARGNYHHIWIRRRTEGDRGLYRRVTTHRLPISLLLQWRQSQRPQPDVTPIRKPSQPTPPAPAPPAAKPEHRSPRSAGGARQARQLTSREGPKLVALVGSLMRGCSGNVQTRDGSLKHVGPSDPDYRAPMTQEEALTTACMNLGIQYDAAREHLKLCRWSFENDVGDSS